MVRKVAPRSYYVNPDPAPVDLVAETVAAGHRAALDGVQWVRIADPNFAPMYSARALALPLASVGDGWGA